MAALGVAWAVCGIVVLTTHSTGATSEAFVVALFAIWFVVVLECLVRYIVVPDRRRYFACRRIEPVLVVLPFFQVTQSPRRRADNRAVGRRARHVSWPSCATAACSGCSWPQRGSCSWGPGSSCSSRNTPPVRTSTPTPTSLWWAVVTVTTVGYGDRFPVTGGGRAVAVILMLVGIGLIGILTATVASFFVQEHTDANKAQLQAAHEDLGARLDDLDTGWPASRPLWRAAPGLVADRPPPRP